MEGQRFPKAFYAGSSPAGDTSDIFSRMRNKNISSEGQQNLNNLVSLLKIRLNSCGKVKSNDQFGNIIYVDCDIYTKETLESFVDLAISEFNSIPKFTDFTLENSRFVDCFAEVLVEGAVIYALSSQALLERGREFTLNDDDGGVFLQPPAVAEILNTQFSTLLGHHWEKLKYIKLEITEFKK